MWKIKIKKKKERNKQVIDCWGIILRLEDIKTRVWKKKKESLLTL